MKYLVTTKHRTAIVKIDDCGIIEYGGLSFYKFEHEHIDSVKQYYQNDKYPVRVLRLEDENGNQ